MFYQWLLFSIILCASLGGLANFCEKRLEKVSDLQKKHSFASSLNEFHKIDPSLIVLGEPHLSYILKKLPKVTELLSPKLSCAFVEFPYNVPQEDFRRLVQGKNTNYFRTKASFDYVPFISWLIDNKIKIIPVDDPVAKSMPSRAEASRWLEKRDEVMFENIKSHLKQCEKSVFLVGKHHITPDVADYKVTLGHKLKKLLREKVALVDLTVPRNFFEEYCSYTQNNLFKEKTLIPTNSLDDIEYSLLVSHSYWSDFDWSIYLPDDPLKP